MSDAWVRLGVVGRAHGIRGAVKLHLDDDDSATLREGLPVRLVVQGQPPQQRRVVRYASGILTLDGLVDRTAAEALRHAELQVRRADFPDLEDDDELYLVDVIGKPVRDRSGQLLGVIRAFSDNGAQPLAHVTPPSGRGAEVLVPFVPPIVVSIGDVVVLDPPGGLFVDADALVVGSAADAAGDDDAHDDAHADETGDGADPTS